MDQPPDRPSRKTYGQLCGLAMALDRIGDRWTPLIMRELIAGPARFSELRASLPGIATNLLTTRLRRMEQDHLVDRVGRGQSTMYSLTENGATIRPTLEALGQWGHGLGPVGVAEKVGSARSLALPLTTAIARGAELGFEFPGAAVELDLDGELLELRLCDEPQVLARQAPLPSASAQSSIHAMSRFLLDGEFDRSDIKHVAGDQELTDWLVDLFVGVAGVALRPAWLGT